MNEKYLIEDSFLYGRILSKYITILGAINMKKTIIALLSVIILMTSVTFADDTVLGAPYMDTEYLPLMDVEFMRLENCEPLTNMISLGANHNGSAYGNQVWMHPLFSDPVRVDESYMVITFEGDNKIRLSFKAYNASIHDWLKRMLGAILGWEASYKVINTIDDDLQSVRYVRSYSDVWYETELLTGQSKSTGSVTITYFDQPSSFDVVLEYTDYIREYAQYNYNNHIANDDVEEIVFEEGSIESTLQDAINFNRPIHKAQRLENLTIINEYLSELTAKTPNIKYSMLTSVNSLREIEIKIEEYYDPTHKSKRRELGKIFYDVNSFSLYWIPERFESALKYLQPLAELRYGNYADQIFDRLHEDASFVVDKMGTTGISHGLERRRADDIFWYYYHPSFDKSITILNKRPIFNLNSSTNLYTDEFSVEDSIFSAEPANIKTNDYYHKYFSKYGILTNDYQAGDVRLQGDRVEYVQGVSGSSCKFYMAYDARKRCIEIRSSTLDIMSLKFRNGNLSFINDVLSMIVDQNHLEDIMMQVDSRLSSSENGRVGQYGSYYIDSTDQPVFGVEIDIYLPDSPVVQKWIENGKTRPLYNY